MIITLIRLGKFLEARAKGQTSEAIKKLIGLQPKTARIVRDGVEIEIPADDVLVGDLVIVRPGEKDPRGRRGGRRPLHRGRIHADRRIAAGAKGPGDDVIGATLNKTGLLQI